MSSYTFDIKNKLIASNSVFCKETKKLRRKTWRKEVFLSLFGPPSSGGVTIKIKVGRCFITSTSLTLHLFLLDSLKLNLNHKFG